MRNFQNDEDRWGRVNRLARDPREEHGGRGRGWHGGGRGHGRPFDHGELRLVILAMVAEKPRHGYEIIKEIEDSFGGSYSPSPGVVYPTLTMLEEMGHATVQETGGRKLYTVTPEGKAVLDANKAQARAARDRMHADPRGRRGVSPQLMRAMENLKLALRLRLRGGALSDEQIQRIVATLDAAAIAIERDETASGKTGQQE